MLNTLVARTLWASVPGVTVRRPCGHRGARPSVTVVIPCYNYGRYLAGCVDSVLSQQDVTVEVIVIDDASTDGSTDDVRRLAQRDSRIRTIFHAQNIGHIATYNEGLAQANGEYTALLSADDLLTPGCLGRATALMGEHPSVGLTYGSALVCTDDDLPPARTTATNWIIWPGGTWLGYLCKTGRNPIRCPEVLMRTSVLHEVGGYSADLPHSADFEMWMRAAAIADVGFVGGADQAYYRMHSNNMHDVTFGVLGDFDQRLASFDKVLADRSLRVSERASLSEAAHRAVAREALSYAIGATVRNPADRESVDEYLAFALRCWPGVRDRREWRILHRQRARSPARPSAVSMHALVRKLRYAALWRRRRMAGA